MSVKRAFAGAAICAVLGACNHGAGRAAVSMKLDSPDRGVADASVYIDEEYVGPLGYVAVRGVRLPVGQHRVTVQKDGYFPWDQAIKLDVHLVRIPD
jgi:hypothetical protein